MMLLVIDEAKATAVKPPLSTERFTTARIYGVPVTSLVSYALAKYDLTVEEDTLDGYD